MIAAYAHDVTEPEWALGWRWDIVLGGPTLRPSSRRAWRAQLSSRASNASRGICTNDASHADELPDSRAVL